MYRKSLIGIESMVVENKPYAGLPKALIPYHYYLKDTGHVIMCIPDKFKPDIHGNYDDYEVGIPVRYVLSHKHKFENGYIFIDVPYDDTLGVAVDEKYYEF